MNAGRGRLGFLRGAALIMCTALSCTTLAEDRVPLPGHVIPSLGAAPEMTRVERAFDADTAPMALTIVLNRNDEAGFQHLLAEQYDPASANFRRWLTAREIADRFGPSVDDYAAVEGFFTSTGFQVVERSPNRHALTVKAPRATVEGALRVRIGDFRLRTSEGTSSTLVFANENDPELPADIARRVQAIAGLSSLARPRPAVKAIKKVKCYFEGVWAGSTVYEWKVSQKTQCEKAVSTCTSREDIASETASVQNDACKGFSDQTGDAPLPARDTPVPWKDVNGAGQTIGITAFDRFQTSDVADYLELFGFAPSKINQLSRVAVNGGASPGADESEVLLDIDTVMMGAQGAQVVVYDAPFGAGAFQSLFNRMITDGVGIVSNSWAYCENQTTAADALSIDAILASAAATGMSVFNAAGDSGSTCLNGSPNAVHVPAGSPNATAVGGTSLTTGPGSTWTSEIWWNGEASAPPTGSGGFGVSRFFARPAYQNGFHASPNRSVPDLAFNSDPNEGVVICQAAKGGCPSPLFWGGTSYAAPAMAAATAQMNQAAGQRLGFLNPQIYPLAGGGRFHTAAELGSDFARVGLGSPIFDPLFLALTGGTRGAVSPTISEVVAMAERIPADGSSTSYVVVKLRDARGHMVPGKTVTLSQSPGGSAVITPTSAVTTAANGAAIFAIRSSAVQNLTFTATNTTDGIVLATKPAVAFEVPPAAAGGIGAFPTTVPNNGVATTTITVTLQDAQGQPTPGKEVQLSQGTGRSIITAPVPPLTNASGQIQFTATNLHAEIVTYTAIVVTDDEVPVPGSAVVTWSGSAPTSCVPDGLPNAAPGYSITPFATGFSARAFSYSNVNFGCAGASDPAFKPDGSFLIANFSSGALYGLPPEGGAASSGNIIANPGLTIGKPVYGKDGRLYAGRGATGSGFFSGAIYEIDPNTGATLRTLASGLSCLSPLSADPISGDLFYTGTCFGAGSDDPNLYRVRNPGGAAPTIESYAVLPGTPNGAVSFAPDGTMFVAAQYLPAQPRQVVRVSGTSQPQPPTVTPIAGLTSIFWVTVAETLPNGAAKSLVLLDPDLTMKLADLTTTPPTITQIVDKAMTSGVIGPDGCLYLSDLETVYKLTPANGACTGTPTNPSPGISITPAVLKPNPAQGSSVTLTATLIGVPPTADVPVRFSIFGANNQLRVVRTNAAGIATLVLEGLFAGSDRIRAHATIGTTTLDSNTSRITWNAGQHSAFLSLNTAVSSAFAGTPVQLSAALFDVSVNPNAPIQGASLQFSVGGQSCNAVTNASGVAICAVTIPSPGNYTLLATFAGTGGYTASSASESFNVTTAAPPPCSTFNDVDSNDPFCANVDWIKNRAVTLGCASMLYCPLASVIRLQMAAFMNRLGTALTPIILTEVQTPGALDLDATPVVCQTADFETGNYSRVAIVDAVLSGASPSAVTFGAQAVASNDGGVTWLPLSTQVQRTSAAANHWGHLRAEGAADLNPAQTVRFGLRMSRGGEAGGANLGSSTCKLRATIRTRG